MGRRRRRTSAHTDRWSRSTSLRRTSRPRLPRGSPSPPHTAPPAGTPQPPTTGPSADPCGQLSSDELASFVATSNGPVQGAPIQDGTVGGNVPASLSLTLGPAASFGSFTRGVAKTYDASTTADVITT